MKRIKAYWWRGDPVGGWVRNWGDELTPLLLKRFSGLTVQWSSVCEADVIAVGSVLEQIPPLWKGTILGAGKLYGSSRLHLHTGTMKILALRGPHSAKAAGSPDCAIGDPGLLADELVIVKARHYDLGIVPHLTDITLAANPVFHPPGRSVKVIRPDGDPLQVIKDIGSCHRIVTSSLHGLIIADAFGIPRRYEPNPHATAAEGGDFKFRDYSASIGLPLVPGTVQEASRFLIEDRKSALYDCFRALKSQMGRR